MSTQNHHQHEPRPQAGGDGGGDGPFGRHSEGPLFDYLAARARSPGPEASGSAAAEPDGGTPENVAPEGAAPAAALDLSWAPPPADSHSEFDLPGEELRAFDPAEWPGRPAVAEPGSGESGSEATTRSERQDSGDDTEVSAMGRTKRGKTAYADGLPPIKVVGVGGGGSNAVHRMIASRLPGVQYLAVNTDHQALAGCDAEVTVGIGERTTRGLGAGSEPLTGRRAAEESRDGIMEALSGAEMVFVTACLGGGTGTGAAPIVAEAARELGALTIGVVTKPFSFEGARRRQQAEEGVRDLQEKVDTLIVVPNDRLLHICGQDVSVTEAFRAADDVLRQGIQGISELITMPGMVNLDFADVRKIMAEAGPALMAIGTGRGEQRSVEAARAAIASPLLEVDITGATGVLFNISGPADLGLRELDQAARVIAEVVDPEAEIIFGTTIDEDLHDEVRITVIATGFSQSRSLAMKTLETAEPEPIKLADIQPDPAFAQLTESDLPTFLRRTFPAR